MRQIKLILFDFSGTLAYLKQPDPKEFFSSLKNFGIELKTDQGVKAFVSLFAKLLGLARDWLEFSEKLFKEFVEEPEQESIQKLAEFLNKNVSFDLYDDVHQIINLPYRKAILSANARFLIEGLGLGKYFKIFTPREVKYFKPDRRAFLAVLEELNVKPEETLMVGDELERDLFPAKELGMEIVLIDRQNKIENPPVKKISSLTELKEILA